MKHSNSFREDDSYYDDFPSDEDEIQGIKAELKKLNEIWRLLHQERLTIAEAYHKKLMLSIQILNITKIS